MELGGDVGANNVFYAYARRLELASLRPHGEFVEGGQSDGDQHTSRSCAISRRCCLALAESFCWTMRRRDMESLSCTFSLFCGGQL